MLLSIITINYNNAEGLRKTLASVASQTYPHIEHIIIDGGSSDNSVEVIREYAENQTKGERLEAKGTGNEVKGERLEVKGEENGAADTPASALYTLHSTPTEISTPIYTNLHQSTPPTHIVRWISEKDTGIYNAMNKGIRMATGDYIQILNSGDILATPDVTERMMAALAERNEKINNQQSKQLDNQQLKQSSGDIVNIVENKIVDIVENTKSNQQSEQLDNQQLKQSTSDIVNIVENKIVDIVENKVSTEKSVDILYGNMIKVNSQRQVVGKSGYTEYSLRQFYSSTLNHDCAYIRKDLFDEYRLYDENLKIVSDWKWYLQAIGLSKVKPEYVDIDVTIFDDGGISETNLALRNKERRQVLEELLPPAVLWDYDTHAFEMEQMNRLRRWKLYPLVYFMERVLFKLEKWGVLRR